MLTAETRAVRVIPPPSDNEKLILSKLWVCERQQAKRKFLRAKMTFKLELENEVDKLTALEAKLKQQKAKVDVMRQHMPHLEKWLCVVEVTHGRQAKASNEISMAVGDGIVVYDDQV